MYIVYMNNKNTFYKCLRIGHTYERKSIKILEKHHFYKIYCNYEYNPYYDLTALIKKNDKLKKVYIEVKYNSLTDKTGFIFLECCKTNLKPSGLSITKSDYYIFFSDSQYWIIKTDRVKSILENTIRTELKKAKITDATEEQLLNYIEHNGLKTKNTIGVLISVSDLLKVCSYNGIHNNNDIYKKRLF